jgi:cell division protease FtsH
VNRNQSGGGFVLFLISGLMLLIVFSSAPRNPIPTWSYSNFVNQLESQQVKSVRIAPGGSRATVISKEGKEIAITVPNDPKFVDRLLANDVDVTMLEPSGWNSGLAVLLNLLFPIILFAGLLLLLRGGAGGGGGAISNFGKSRARQEDTTLSPTKFSDVAGVEAAKLELQEVVDFLSDPGRFTSVGARIPRGVLLVGPPGTGKTLLARAVAGEAGVPFFSISGSEFVEMFVGVGASRVRDLFTKAKQNAPCIIFIDEIDAVGRQRGAGLGNGNDEREQTLNQLLTELDGFANNTGVIVIAATNRPDVLDAALLRPGRFDRQVVVDRPDLEGRIAIFGVHSRGKRLAEDVSLEYLARRVPGFTGADIANLMNEAAILTARRKLTAIGKLEINDAIDRVLAGAERRGRYISEDRKRLIAYHEAGHALLGALMKDYDLVQKISIIPRGRAAGLTWFTPNEEQDGLYTKNYLKAQITVALGGRCAEELIFGEGAVTTGASNDLQQVTRIAREMVTRYGMSDLGPIAFANNQGGMYLGREIGGAQEFSQDTATHLDAAISGLIFQCYEQAQHLLQENKTVLDEIAQYLIVNETMEADEFSELLESHQIQHGAAGTGCIAPQEPMAE